jgi:xanthine dehydrogenase accessory factor
MRSELLGLAARLAAAGEPFVMAVVVRREPASSAQVGNMAVISRRGEFHGWLGGSCIRPTVIREAQAALADGTPRLISLSPEASADRRSGVTVFPMTCHSGGSVDIYVEPVLPAPQLLVFGTTPVAQALARLGKGMGYTVHAVDPEADASTFAGVDRVATSATELREFPRDEFPGAGGQVPSDQIFTSRPVRRAAVVATHGERDEEAIAEALELQPDYLGVVASRKRFAQIRDTLVARGIPPAALERIKSPAGVDIGAKTPEEVALSILAEIVQVRRQPREAAPSRVPDAPAEALDPVCGMTVQIATTRHHAEHGGRTFYFCCGGCRQRFLAAPEQYEAAVPR